MLDLTGEEQEITVTDSTVITKQSMGGGQGAPGGEAPEKPDGDNADDNADAKSEDTDDSADASDSEKPDGEARTVTARHQMVQARPKRYIR